MIIGPPDTLYEEGIFNAIISFPSNYPRSAPTVKFTTEIWHPNVSADDGRVSGYGLAILPDQIVESIRSMLSRPNNISPANLEAAITERDFICYIPTDTTS